MNSNSMFKKDQIVHSSMSSKECGTWSCAPSLEKPQQTVTSRKSSYGSQQHPIIAQLFQASRSNVQQLKQLLARTISPQRSIDQEKDHPLPRNIKHRAVGMEGIYSNAQTHLARNWIIPDHPPITISLEGLKKFCLPKHQRMIDKLFPSHFAVKGKIKYYPLSKSVKKLENQDLHLTKIREYLNVLFEAGVLYKRATRTTFSLHPGIVKQPWEQCLAVKHIPKRVTGKVFLVDKNQFDSSKARLVVNFSQFSRNKENRPFPKYISPSLEGLETIIPRTEYFISLDLSQGFYHIPMDVASSAKFLISDGIQIYAFRKAPMGVGISPWLLTMFTNILAESIRQKFSIFCLTYMDDFLLAHSSYTILESLCSFIIHQLSEIGIQINRDKSTPEPLKQCTYMGYKITYNSIHISDRYQRKLNSIVQFLQHGRNEYANGLGWHRWKRRYQTTHLDQPSIATFDTRTRARVEIEQQTQNTQDSNSESSATSDTPHETSGTTADSGSTIIAIDGTPYHYQSSETLHLDFKLAQRIFGCLSFVAPFTLNGYRTLDVFYAQNNNNKSIQLLPDERHALTSAFLTLGPIVRRTRPETYRTPAKIEAATDASDTHGAGSDHRGRVLFRISWRRLGIIHWPIWLKELFSLLYLRILFPGFKHVAVDSQAILFHNYRHVTNASVVTKLLAPLTLYYVRSENNPADLPTRSNVNMTTPIINAHCKLMQNRRTERQQKLLFKINYDLQASTTKQNKTLSWSNKATVVGINKFSPPFLYSYIRRVSA
uniref:Protein P n=1 Tax=Fish-associated hepatitis B virus TaxID=3003970 RepID=A0A9E9JMS9_HBV|nr:MAG: polymerase [Fish-associated hepatitis B virus]